MKWVMLSMLFVSLGSLAFADGVIPPEHSKSQGQEFGVGSIKQCTVYGYRGNAAVAGFYSYGSQKSATCAVALAQCSSSNEIYSSCEIVYFGQPQGDE